MCDRLRLQRLQTVPLLTVELLASMESLTDEQRALFADGGQLDDYEVLKPIGKGKFSVVFKAKRRHDGQAVALKKIAIFDMMNLKAREKTLKEYLDAFVQNNELYIAFEWAEAGDLKRQIRKANEKGVPSMNARYGDTSRSSVNRIMHRDLKPANIFLTLKGVVKVGDLGLARIRWRLGQRWGPAVYVAGGAAWRKLRLEKRCVVVGVHFVRLAMLRSPFKSEGLNLVGLFQKINKGYYEEIPEVYSEHLRGIVKQMISLTASNRPSVQEVWEFCRTRPSRTRAKASGCLPKQNNGTRKDPETRSARSRNSRSKSTPETETPSRPSSSDQQQETPPQSRPPSSQGDASNTATEESVKRRHAEARMELLFERLKILRYEKILKKRISPTNFASDIRTLPRVTPQSRFEDMCTLSYWLISLLGGEVPRNDDQNDEPPIVAAQKILLAAEKAGVFAVAQLSAPTLTSGVGVEVCELLDALTAAVVSGEAYCTTPPEYPREPIETLESCDELDVTDDDGQQNQSIGESTASLALEYDDAFSRWVVVKEENPYPIMTDNDRENAMIHTDIDPVAWELERRRMLPKLHAVLQDKRQRRPAESSWRVRLDQVQTQGGLIIAAQKNVQHEIAQIQATRQEQAEQSQRYEKQLNKRFLRARRLYDESTTRLAKSQDEMQTAQERVNRATVEVVRLQAARSELADAVKAADARITDNSRLLERKRQVQHLIDENRELGMRLQVLHDYWTRKQQHAIQCSHLDPNSYDYQANAEADCEYDDTGLGLALLEQVEPFLTFERIQFNAEARLATSSSISAATMSLTGPLQDLDETPVVRNALLHIGLCILPWFWMGYSCKYIRIEAGYLNSEQVHFWEEFYQSVLSEYLYLHGLDRDRLHIIVDAPASEALPVLADRKLEQRDCYFQGRRQGLTRVYQLLSSSATPCAWLQWGDRPQEFERSWRFKEIVEMTGASAFRFEHNMEDKTWESEVAGTRYQPAGHPWAALVAFDSVLAAILGDFTHVAVGNERSANYDNNVVHEGRPVNHQYDKSFDFETRAHAYIRKYLVEDLHYFSALQHLWEVQIAAHLRVGRWRAPRISFPSF
ncbi:Intra-flagellar transport protein 57 [Phytophthora cactorum]|nr:Intra-flagellar transport protein 57 [Phytophthora cactorum]